MSEWKPIAEAERHKMMFIGRGGEFPFSQKGYINHQGRIFLCYYGGGEHELTNTDEYGELMFMEFPKPPQL